MEAYCQEVRKLEAKFDALELTHVLHRDNKIADTLAKMMSTWDAVPAGVLIQEMHMPSIKVEIPSDTEEPHPERSHNTQQTAQEVMVVTPDWTKPFLNYILRDVLP